MALCRRSGQQTREFFGRRPSLERKQEALVSASGPGRPAATIGLTTRSSGAGSDSTISPRPLYGEGEFVSILQFCLRLLQPVRHPHLAVHRRRRGQVLASASVPK
jgi:hypothetical protein